MTHGDDDDGVLIISSCMGNCGGWYRLLGAVLDENGLAEEEYTDWEELNGKDRDEPIINSLKKHGNVKKRQMSASILKDMLGSDGEFSLQGIKESHLMTMKGEQMKMNNVYHAVKHFKRKTAIRRARLKANIEYLKNGTSSKREYSWRDEYDKIVKAKRGE